jgi:hypothetical protein
MTIIGPNGTPVTKTNLNQGVYMRKGTRLAIRNSLVSNYPEGGFMVCPRTRPVILANNNAEFRSNLVQTDTLERTFCYDTSVTVIPDPALSVFLTNAVNKDSILVNSTDFKFTTPYPQSGAPNLMPLAGSPALWGTDFTGTDFSNAFFVKTNYRGAVGATNWAAQSAWADWK